MKHTPAISTLLCITATLALVSPAAADVIVLANRTLNAVETQVTLPGDKPQRIKLGPGGVRPVPVIDEATVEFHSGKDQKRYRITANSIVYFFSKQATPNLVELTERRFCKKGNDNKLPAQPKPATPKQLARLRKVGIIPIKLLVDDDEPAVTQIWQKRLKDRIAQASDILEKYCRVRLAVAETDTWDSQDGVTDFYFTIREFEKKVKPGKKAALAIGFSSQYEKPNGRVHMGGTRGPLHPYILIREWSQHVAYSERLEIVVHEIGHVLGAPHSPDNHSVMRPLVSDGKARDRDYKIRFDPMNTLVMYLFCEELRLRGSVSLRHFQPERRELLTRIYRQMQKEMPKDTSAQRYVTLLARASKPLTAQQLPSGVVEVKNGSHPEKKPIALTRKMAVALRPASSGDPSKAKTLISATRFVVDAIRSAAEKNGRSAIAAAVGSQNPTSRDNDRLTETYVRQAAQAAQQLPPQHAKKAFLLGLAIGLDTSDKLRDHAAIGRLVELIESDELRRRRLTALGTPTMNGRHDLAQHFAVSCAITSLTGQQSAHSIGIAKETADSQGGSGFSFLDLEADLAGASFAKHLIDSKLRLSDISSSFFTAAYLPLGKDLPEGLSAEEFKRQFGSTTDKRFRDKMATIQQRISNLPGYSLMGR